MHSLCSAKTMTIYDKDLKLGGARLNYEITLFKTEATIYLIVVVSVFFLSIEVRKLYSVWNIDSLGPEMSDVPWNELNLRGIARMKLVCVSVKAISGAGSGLLIFTLKGARNHLKTRSLIVQMHSSPLLLCLLNNTNNLISLSPIYAVLPQVNHGW